MSMGELNLILRTAAVQSAAERQLENTNRINISGIAAITESLEGMFRGFSILGGARLSERYKLAKTYPAEY